MKPAFFFLILAAFTACAPRMTTDIISKQAALPAGAFVVVLQEKDEFTVNAAKIGTLRSRDNGFSVNCAYSDVIGPLKQLARQNGANVIRITQHRPPDHHSSCDRITADIYYVTDTKSCEKEIEWTAGRKLTAADFKGEPHFNSGYAAETSAGFGFQTTHATAFAPVKIHIRNTFNCSLSWILPEQKENAYVLAHEQLHFDISEVYARLLRRKFAENPINGLNVNKAYDFFNGIFAQYKKRQDLYDEETNHGIRQQKQAEWRAMIDLELQGLEAYAQM